MLDLQRIIVLCLPSLLFAATMEPGKQFHRPCSQFSRLIVLKCFSHFDVCQHFLRQLVDLARVQYMSLGNFRMILYYEVFYDYGEMSKKK